MSTAVRAGSGQRAAERGHGRVREPGVLHLLAPKLRAFRRRAAESSSFARVLILGLVGFVFWSMLFVVIFRMLRYFQGAAGIGDVLAVKLLGVVMLTLLSVLLLSNVITALTSFFLSRDLELLIAGPVDGLRIYGARLLETMLHSSWMVVLVLIPVLWAYGWVYDGGLLFAAVAMATVACVLVIPAVIGTVFTLLLVNVFPARRARDLLALIALFGAAGVILLFRLMQPEQLARPEGFRNLVQFVAELETPRSVWLPSEWAADAIAAPLLGLGDLFPLFLLASTAAASIVFGAWLHERYYREGFSRSQEGAELREEGRGRRRGLERVLGGVNLTARSLVAKDIRNFFRDSTQWSQLILLAVLVVIYIYNIHALPLWTGERVSFFLTNVIAFVNIGLSGFVLASIAARFVFPLISLEGRTFWLLRSSPLDLRALVWTKFWVGVAPLLVLSLALTLGTNLILRVGPFMMAVSLVTTGLMTFAICAIALGFGALFPRFDTENAAQVATGFGGLMFMMTSVAYLVGVVMLEAWPVYAVLQAGVSGRGLEPGNFGGLVLGLGSALLLTAVAVVVPLRAAMRRVEALER